MKKKFTLIVVLSILIRLSTIAQVPTNGLIAYWPFNGNANDESGNNINGTISGATSTTDRFGAANSAYSFNGTNDYPRLCIREVKCSFIILDYIK